MSTNEVATAIKSLAGQSTADLIGIAPGEAFSTEELGELGEAFGPVRSVIVLAQHIADPVQEIRFFAGASYRSSEVAVSLSDAMLADACWRVAHLLEHAGYGAAIPRNQRYGGEQRPAHQISFKKAGALAGLGAFGRSQLLLHPDWGPWMWLRAVVTEASLPPDRPISFSPCEGCAQCVAACPSGALTEVGIDRERCRSVVGYAARARGALRFSAHGQVNCEECRRACPVGPAPPRLALRES